MSTQELIIKELEQLPKPLHREVYDFARFLRERAGDELFVGYCLANPPCVKTGKRQRKMPHGQTCYR
jgi:hypothetical protein